MTPGLSVYPRSVEVLQTLLRFDTTNPPGRTSECIEYIKTTLQRAGIPSVVLGKDEDRLNLITRLKGRGEAPPLMLYGHVDVVSVEGQHWEHPPFSGDIVNGCVWGRGALDMKGGIAMMLGAILRAKAEGLEPAGDVIFAALADEEIGGEYGAKFMVEVHAEMFDGVRYAIGEGGGFNIDIAGQKFYPILVAEKQGCGIVLRVRGESGHGSRVVQGGAMAKLGKVLTRLDENLLPVHITPVFTSMVKAIASALSEPNSSLLLQLLEPGKTEKSLELLEETGYLFAPLVRNTFNPTIVHGGSGVNIIPSEIVLNCDMRLLPGFSAEDGIREVREVIGNDAELEIVYYSPNNAQPDMGMFGTLAEILHSADPEGIPIPYIMSGVTDARFFARLGIQTYGFLPMRFHSSDEYMQTIHAPNERIPVTALEFGAESIYRVLQEYRG